MAMVHALPFAALLRRYRLAASLTQEALAARAGLSARGISDLERGVRHAPYQDTVTLLAAALSLTAQERALFEHASGRWRSPPATQSSASSRSASGDQLATGPATPSLVGRRAELELLARHLAGEESPLLLLAGEPGIGKTRLLREAAARAREAGWSVLSGGCQRRGGQDPYAPLLHALQGRLGQASPKQLRADLTGCAWLVRLLPELAETTVVPAPLWTLPPEQERRLMFQAVRRFLANVTGPSGVLLVLDDLQWAGQDALDLLATLLRAPAEVSLRVVAAYRDTEVHPDDPLAGLLADLARDGVVTQHRLSPLSSHEAAELFDSLVEGSTGTHAAVVTRLLERTGGVPFYIVSCAQALLLGRLDAEQAEGIPWSVAQNIRQRVVALPMAAQELLAAAAVIGRQAPHNVLVSMATWPEQDVLDALEAACQAQLLVEEESAYRFAHDLIREVVEADLSTARRRALHRQVAEVLAREPAVYPAKVLAYHYGQAGKLELALGYLLQAVARARQAAAHREVASLLVEAIACAERIGQQQVALELREQRGKACHTIALWAEAAVEFEAVLNGLPAEHIERRAEILATLAEVRYWQIDSRGTRRCATEALALAEQIGRDDLAAHAMAALALADSHDGNLQTSLQHYQQAFVRAGPQHLPSLTSGVEMVGLTHYWLGNFADAVRSNQHALELARQSSDTTTMARALANLGLALGGIGRYAEAFQTFATVRQFAQEQEIMTWLARAIAMCGGLHLDLFDFPGAQVRAEEAREIGHSARWPQAIVSGGIDLLLNFARRGDVGRTETLVEQVAEAVAVAQGTHGWLWQLRFAAVKGEMALARGDWEEAVRAADDAITQGQRRGRVKYQALGLEIRAKALAALGRQHEGIAHLRQALTLVRPTGNSVMFLGAATPLLNLDGDDMLLAEAHTHAEAIVAALPDEEMRRRFASAEPIYILMR